MLLQIKTYKTTNTICNLNIYLSFLMMEICTSLLSPIVSSMKAAISLLKRML